MNLQIGQRYWLKDGARWRRGRCIALHAAGRDMVMIRLDWWGGVHHIPVSQVVCEDRAHVFWLYRIIRVMA